MNPLYMSSIIGGFHDKKRYLAYVDLYGTIIEAKRLSTAMATYFATPIIYNYWNEN